MSGTTGTARPQSYFLQTWFAGGQPTGAIGSQALRDLAVTVTQNGATMTSGSSLLMSTNYLVVNKTSGSPTAVTLPAAPVPFAQEYTVKDGKGDAATNNITITPSSGLIDNAASFVMNVNFALFSFFFDGTNWWVR